MYLCPHCNKPGISTLRRSWLGSAISATCTVCGSKIGVPYGKSMLALTPLFLGMVLASLVRDISFVASVLIWLVGIGAMFWMFFKFVPLIKR